MADKKEKRKEEEIPEYKVVGATQEEFDEIKNSIFFANTKREFVGNMINYGKAIMLVEKKKSRSYIHTF